MSHKPEQDEPTRPLADDIDELPGIDAQGEPPEAEDAQTDDAQAEQPDEPDQLLTRVQQERDELEQRLLRTAADYQNYVRRAQQNVAAAEQQALLEVSRALVTVLDHFDRALDVDESKATVKDVLAGLKIVHDELIAALAKFGIERVDAKPGEPFDPNKHEAMLRTEAEGIDPDHVAQQFQPGYAIKDKTIRPAQVSVAS